jgi:hypothetical protein
LELLVAWWFKILVLSQTTWDGTPFQKAGRDPNAVRELSGLAIGYVDLGRFDRASVCRQNRRIELDPDDLFIRPIDACLQLLGYDANGPPQFRVKARLRNPDPITGRKSARPLAHAVIVAADGKTYCRGREAIWGDPPNW